MVGRQAVDKKNEEREKQKEENKRVIYTLLRHSKKIYLTNITQNGYKYIKTHPVFLIQKSLIKYTNH